MRYLNLQDVQYIKSPSINEPVPGAPLVAKDPSLEVS